MVRSAKEKNERKRGRECWGSRISVLASMAEIINHHHEGDSNSKIQVLVLF